ncbi:lipid IV(A) 3-deoxy-D-manno-octulosonic acid transferase [Massilia sp. YIM B02769]|uniref:lipid IV(A) 3-deoxy-D-manno-octulosonic acid transferase n=1 Tax=Massilia sp. YIM B02769 TaxID=3050129 RepID=UPI0025B69648|nr:lipid IV(A) 3-deoxy-D-manno-octulosonic acid transferase [Massilia sp. YIM B02769]MDN4057935.1 lipid IV(A) 3-deoxy-D-manno-octulosonic acid transferase [Massilia sp. YIM B02769]
MNRSLYSLLWWLALPLVLGRLWWRGRKEPGYRRHVGERLGFYGPVLAPRRTFMVHAVSVGETRAAEPLVEALLARWPDCRILLTHMTPTGRATGAALFGKHGERVVQSFLPYDTGLLVRRFLRHFRPQVCILMETEVWPNLIAGCAAEHVPVALVNARLSKRSLRRGQRFGGIMVDAARAITTVAAQTEDDANRIRSLGAPQVAVTGSIKFDVVPPEAALEKGAWLRARIGERLVFLCASTRDGEEALILDAWGRLASKPANALLAIVPRHPQRFDEVAQLVAARGLSLQRRSRMDDGAVDADVLLGDSMGEMFAYYAACDCAFIGGSLLPLGGQNLIEACAVGKPVLVGEHTFNFLDATIEAVAAGGAVRVGDADALVAQAARLLADDAARAAMGAQAAAWAGRHRGATLRTVELLQRIIP